MNTVVEKYMKEAERRTERGLPIGEFCEYCHGSQTTISVTGYLVCASCGAEAKKCYGYVFGVPVYDIDDVFEVARFVDIYCPLPAGKAYV